MIGQILDAKYRIDKQLGAGGMGTVYLGTHLGTTRVVAVKVIAPKWVEEPEFLARFQREAQACGRLRHPNIVNVTDFGIAKAFGADLPYLVMEYLDGNTLSEFQKANPSIGLPLIADLLDQIGLALAEAHKHGIVHRDLKPDNIWLEPNGRGGYIVKVLDFGVAKLNSPGGWAPTVRQASQANGSKTASTFSQARITTDELETAVITATPTPQAMGGHIASDDIETVAFVPAPIAESFSPSPAADEIETVAITPTPTDFSSGSFDSGASARTTPGSLLGTPAYMSPEQAFGKEIDFRSDIYSLAVVAYSLVCGRLPFAGKSREFLEYHRSGSPPPPATIAKVPRDVSDAILAGLARNPEDRPESSVAFTRRFRNAVDAEFLALRRSKAFLLQHLAAYVLLMMPIYGTLLGMTAISVALSQKLLPVPAVQMVLAPFVAAALFIFSDNVLRASAALMAVDEQVRVRRFLSFRVFWKLVKMQRVLMITQAQSAFFFGPGWVVGDCLWPVVCVVEKLSGRAAVQRSRDLMTGLKSAGRALAIRHFALAALAIGEVIKSMGVFWQSGSLKQANTVITATWFPIFALFAAAPLFLYDRTAANPSGPLLQLDRTPEVRTTTRAFSVSSTIWLVLGALDLLLEPLKIWLLGGR